MKECPLCGLGKIIEENSQCLLCEGEGCRLCKHTGKGIMVHCTNKNCAISEDEIEKHEELKIFFSFTKECEDITFRAELATDDNKNYVLFLSDHDGAAVYPFEKEELKVVYNAIGKILGNNN